MFVRQRKSHEYLMQRALHICGYTDFDYISVSCGAFDPFIFLFWLLGKKCVRLWIGTDALKATRFWHYRVRAKICSFFCENLALTDWMIKDLNENGIQAGRFIYYHDKHYVEMLYPNGAKHNNKVFTVLAYRPKGSIFGIDLNWRYGIDVVLEIEKRHPDWNFVYSDGSTHRGNVFNSVDVYLRPVRYDGDAAMNKEAAQLGIPVIWSYETGEYIEPNVEKIENRLKDIEEAIFSEHDGYDCLGWN